MNNHKCFTDKWLFPQTEKDQSGRSRKMGIEPNEFNGSVEGLKFHFSFAKREGLYCSLPITQARILISELRRALSKPEKSIFTMSNGKAKNPVTIACGRQDDLVPFMALSGDVNGQRRTKRFYFTGMDGWVMTHNGSPVSDLEAAERYAKEFADGFHAFIEWCMDVYNPRDFNNTGGGNYGSGGYNSNNGGGNNGGNNGGGNYNNQSNNSAPQATNQFDDIL